MAINIIMMQQGSTKQRSSVYLRRRLTNFKMLVSHSMSAVLKECLLLNVKSSPQSVLRNMSSLSRMLSKSAASLDFKLSQSSVATYCRYGENLCGVSYESIGERIMKLGPHLPKLLSNITGYTFLRHITTEEL